MSTIIWTGGEYRTKCVVGLERDGVLNTHMDACSRPEDFTPIDGSLEALSTLRRKGYKTVIITDQRGVERGLLTQDEVVNVNNHMSNLLGEAGVYEIDGLYYSIGASKQDPFVKPNTGMFKRCETEHPDIKFKEGYYVGHTIKDLKAAWSMGATPVLVRTGKGAETELELNKYAYRLIKPKTLIFDNLAAFVEYLA